MTILTDDLVKSLSGEMTPKFLATRDEQGIPNIVPVISIEPYGTDLLIFGNYLMSKTVRNLEKVPQVSVAVLNESFAGATLSGKFLGFQRAGEYVDKINSSRFLRYNAYTGIRNAGSIQVEAIQARCQYSKLSIFSGNLLSRALTLRAHRFSSGSPVVNRIVRQTFEKIVAVKAVAFIDPEGNPLAFPVMSLQPVSADFLVFLKSNLGALSQALRPGLKIAACVLTPQACAFQVKGQFKDVDRFFGGIAVDEVFHATVPLPGKKIQAD